LFAGVDLTRTVGWFTTLYPLRICPDAPPDSPGAALAAVKEQLRSVPNGGLGYGLLRYGPAGDEALRRILAAAPAPLISFNYQGQIQTEAFDPGAGPAFRVLDQRSGASRSPLGRRPFPLEVSAQLRDGEMVIEWTYTAHPQIRELAEGLAANHVAALNEIILASSALAGGARARYTPSDFPELGLNQSEIDALVDELEGAPGDPEEGQLARKTHGMESDDRN
jgi:non-ribosomal peptide synthase protein (TIGR01720 family)